MAAAKPVSPKQASAEDGANRRRFDRRHTKIAARLEHEGRVTEGVVTNLSLQGCLFSPQLRIETGSRVKLHLSGEAKPVAATVKGVSDQGVHCLLHAGGATLGRLSTGLDDMALLMLNAARPHDLNTKPAAKKPKA